MRDVPTLRRPASAATERDDLASRRMIVNSHRYRTRFECPTSTRCRRSGSCSPYGRFRDTTAIQPVTLPGWCSAFSRRYMKGK